MLFFLNLSQFFIKSKNIHLNINSKVHKLSKQIASISVEIVNTCVCKRGNCKIFISLSYNFHVFDFGRERTGFVCMFIRTFFIENTTYLYMVSGYLKKIPLKNKEFRFLAPYLNLCSKTLHFGASYINLVFIVPIYQNVYQICIS